MVVRGLRPGDETLAAGVVNAANLEDDPDGYAADADYMTSFLGDEDNYLVAAFEDDGTPLGFALGSRLPRVDGPRSMMYLYEIGVIENRRNQGIGKAIMGEMVRICREEGLLKMFAGTDKDNLPVVRIYSATGGIPGDGNALDFCWDFSD